MTGLIGSSKQAAPVGISPQILRSSLTCHAAAFANGANGMSDMAGDAAR